MSGAAERAVAVRGTTEPRLVRWALIGGALAFLGIFLLVPLLVVFTEALRGGAAAWAAALLEPDARAAIRLTMLTALFAVPFNVVFGIAAAWAIARFEFFGKSVLTTLIDMPLSVSPVVSGLVYILLLGPRTPIGEWFGDQGVRVIFAPPGIVLATIFVTLPLVARELIPLLQSQGTSEEEAALTLGASGWQTFFRVSLPKMRWGLLYGIVLCNARAIGEFGAVSVVSGHIRGLTTTAPLHVEILYNEYQLGAAFAVASLLAMFALVTLVAKSVLEWRAHRRRGARPRAVEPVASV
jgi:sulfate transport system permease protein